MSLFQPCSDDIHETQDVFHLAAHDCDVIFSRHDAGESDGPKQNTLFNRNLVVHGRVRVRINDQETVYSSDDWFEIPVGTPHHIDYLEDASTIEFWFGESQQS